MPELGHNHESLFRESHKEAEHDADSAVDLVLYKLLKHFGDHNDVLKDGRVRLASYCLGRSNMRDMSCRPSSKEPQPWQRTAMRDMEVQIMLCFHCSVRPFTLERVHVKSQAKGQPQLVPTKSSWLFNSFVKKECGRLRTLLQAHYTEKNGKMCLEGHILMGAFQWLLWWATDGSFSWHGFHVSCAEEQCILQSCIALYVHQENSEAALLPNVSMTIYAAPQADRPWPEFWRELRMPKQ